MKYKGDGTQSIPGVPMRDLTPAEWDNLSEQQKEECLKTDLYQAAKVAPKKEKETKL